MNGSKPNLRFNYLYRDASNYKSFGSVVFSNSNNLSIEYVDTLIIECLIDKEFFSHDDFGVPKLFFGNKNEDDHGWHEYVNIEPTGEMSIKADINDFISIISKIGN